MQPDLFTATPPLPPGLVYETEFLAREEEAALLEQIRALPFEEARTQLCYGERLRRARRPTEAQPLLRAALDTFEQLGAEPWAKRTDSELRSTGASRP